MTTVWDALQRPRDEYDDLYSVLGCQMESSMEQIRQEYRIKALQLHPDKSGKVDGKFERVAFAYSVLGDVDKRLEYDGWLKSGLCVSFRDYQQRVKGHALHWSKSTTPSLDYPQSTDDLYARFRNYEL
jgi:curved DNA-binding protein CbpA